MTTLQTGVTKTLYQDKNRNVLAGAWSPAGDRIVFGIGGFAAFFDGFNSLFLKPADRIGDGAQVAIVNPDGSGFEELTAGLGNNAFPSFAPFNYAIGIAISKAMRSCNSEQKANMIA